MRERATRNRLHHSAYVPSYIISCTENVGP